MNNFQKNHYLIIKQAINKELANYLYNYFSIKKDVAHTVLHSGFVSPYTEYFGHWNDTQVPGSFSHYADIAMDTLLLKVQPIMEEHTKIKLVPTYSYTRMYIKGNELKRHKDRSSCEISTTMNLGGDIWPIFIDPNPKNGKISKNGYHPGNSKGIQVVLEPGDMLVYKGCMLEHWREPFEGNECCQVFLHYNNALSDFAEENKYDKRPHLGLPPYFKNFK
jgi:hypothetical protein